MTSKMSNIPNTHIRQAVRRGGACSARRRIQAPLFRVPITLLFASLLSISSALRIPSLAANTPATPDASARVPILVELFTSEGCSSCPPADALLQQMDASQPVNGAQLIVLSEHVDYWNHDGWKDPYSSAQFTARQAGYVRALGLQTAYTPQMIVDGKIVLKGTGLDIAQTFEKAAAIPKVSVRIDSAAIDASSQIKVKVEANGAEKHGGEVWVAIALDHAASQVSAGENSGRHLEHVAVVEELKKAGKLEKGKSFSQDVVLKLKPDTDPKNVRIIAFVQESNEGKVLGAASTKIANP
ncbi:MAG TPA: DUF1223 domain-containing protein [Candidatus Acidoferrum sp.]